MLKADGGEPTAGAIYTIGHSNLAIPDFYTLLKSHGIATVADVRRFPQSRRHPQYAKDALRASLLEAGIVYLWLGEALGGFRSGGYESYVTDDSFRQGISELEAIARRTPAAIMCAERDPADCHRRFIADALVRRGWRVLHIVPGGLFPHTVCEELFPLE